jgi:hypothetical protein
VRDDTGGNHQPGITTGIYYGITTGIYYGITTGIYYGEESTA